MRGRVFIWLEGELYLLKVVYVGAGAQSLDGLSSMEEFREGLETTAVELDQQSDRAIDIYIASLRKHFLKWAMSKGLYKAGADPEFAKVAWKSWMKSTHFLVLEKHDPTKAIPAMRPAEGDLDWRLRATLQHEWGFAGEPVAAFAIQALNYDELSDFERYFEIHLPRDLPEPSRPSVIPNLFWVPKTDPVDSYFGGSIWVHGLFIKKEKVNQFIFQSMLRAALGLGLFGYSFLVPKGEVLQTSTGLVEGPVSWMPSRAFSFCWDPRTCMLHQLHGFREMPELAGRRPAGVDYLQFLQVNMEQLAFETLFLGQQTSRSMKRDVFYIDRVVHNKKMVETNWSVEHPLETLAALQGLLRLSDSEFALQLEQATKLSKQLPPDVAQLVDWSYSLVAAARVEPGHPLHALPSQVAMFLPASVVVPAETCSLQLLNEQSLLGFRLNSRGGDYVSDDD